MACDSQATKGRQVAAVPGQAKALGVASEVDAEAGVLMVCCSSPISGLESQRTPSWGRSLSSQVLYPECRVQILTIALALPRLPS